MTKAKMKQPICNLLTIAGSDPSGGAGIQADLKAFSACGCYGMSVITGLTAQNTQGVQAIHPLPADFVAQQFDSLLADIRIDAIKIGMLSDVRIIDVIADRLADFNGPIVLDPVMIAKGGAALIDSPTQLALRDRLLPLAGLVTPNLPELATLVAQDEATTPEQMLSQAQQLLDLGAQAVLAKGGHLPGDHCQDLLLSTEQALWFSHPRLATHNTHGTGCTLSSAIASFWAQTGDLAQAIQQAKDYINAAIAHADQLTVGSGHGPTHHFHAWWSIQ
ncbi:phosphomethylpyrimidine kinase [Thiomicrospira aerophila AL3]|uniref:hydroxymethylpyrimidine kinase n=1 Tax=Thiomicrospira aerophila AL3 TaxID=717772 RepID=W0DUS1_9GAMM|nr:bifunctional hydroxymethylpyrimidine kinase/phosphomethylpyrimidine kinase [Thiomicrospira aerophila]AHF00724.1 phosphomethylpyrimidine kinase [Thiomicrospira aerophila AL3]